MIGKEEGRCPQDSGAGSPLFQSQKRRAQHDARPQLRVWARRCFPSGSSSGFSYPFLEYHLGSVVADPPPIHHLPVGMFPAPPRGAAFGMLGTCASLKLRGWGRTHRAPPAFWTARSSVPCRCPVGTRRHGCPLPQPRCGAASEEISVRSVEAARCRWRRPCGAEWSCRGSHAGAVQE